MPVRSSVVRAIESARALTGRSKPNALRTENAVSGRRRWRKGPLRPVLKHGPRSLTCARAFERETPGRSESERHHGGERGSERSDLRTDGRPGAGPVESERARWDPKDGELSVSRTKPEETLVEVRSGTDVQIVRLTCV